jgi:hypothetical protein
VSNANEPDPVSNANEPEPVSNGGTLRMEVVRGGDPGDEILAALAAVLTRPVVVVPDEVDDQAEAPRRQPRWLRAARLEGVVPGRRISSIADMDWRRG